MTQTTGQTCCLSCSQEPFGGHPLVVGELVPLRRGLLQPFSSTNQSQGAFKLGVFLHNFDVCRAWRVRLKDALRYQLTQTGCKFSLVDISGQENTHHLFNLCRGCWFCCHKPYLLLVGAVNLLGLSASSHCQKLNTRQSQCWLKNSTNRASWLSSFSKHCVCRRAMSGRDDEIA